MLELLLTIFFICFVAYLFIIFTRHAVKLLFIVAAIPFSFFSNYKSCSRKDKLLWQTAGLLFLLAGLLLGLFLFIR